MNFTEKLITILLLILLIGVAIAFVGGLFFFGFAGLFYLIGIEYESYTSLILFVVAFLCIGFVVDIFFEGLAKCSNGYIEKKWQQIVMFLLSSFAGNFLVLVIVDSVMTSISLSFQAKLILAVCLALIDQAFSSEGDKKEDRKA